MILFEHNGSVEEWPIFEATQFPMLIGDSTQDAHWECPCGETIARGINSRQMLDVLIKCGSCGRLLESPSRQPGEPLASPRVVEPGGPWPLGSIDLTGGALNSIVGQRALMGEARESGRLIPGFYDPQLSQLLNLNPSTLHWLADKLREALGEHWPGLVRSDEKGLTSPTPPARRHRVVELVDTCAHLAQTFGDVRDSGGPTSQQFEDIAESLTIVHLAERWQHHPQWPLLRAGFAYETAHTTTLLAAASYLSDANHGVGIHGKPDGQGVGISDIWVDVNLEDRVEVEVKVPTILVRPTELISGSRAETLLKRLVKKSGTQRGKNRSSLLIIGGHRLDDSRAELIEAARRLFNHQVSRWSNLAGILIVDHRVDFSIEAGPSYRIHPGIRADIATHPGYDGRISVGPSMPQISELRTER